MSLPPKALLTAILALIVGVILSVPHSTLSAKEKMQIPNDFEVYLHSAGRMPLSSAEALLIDSSGHCKYFKRSVGSGDEFALISEFDLTAKAMEKIYDTVKKERFFDLKSEYRDPTVMDGDYAEMEITADGKTHTVKTVNIKVDAFDKIVREINALLPEEARIRYNALHIKDYNRVKR